MIHGNFISVKQNIFVSGNIPQYKISLENLLKFYGSNLKSTVF